jgi:phosphate transport system substrate-binding protein
LKYIRDICHKAFIKAFNNREGAMKKLCVFCVVVMFILISVFASADEIKVGAGQAPTSNILKPIKEPFQKATGTSLSILPCGPKAALEELLKGSVEVALGGLAFDDWIAMMKQEGSEVKDPGSLQHIPVGKDRIIAMIHKDNPVNKLSKEQLKDIFTGKITNWKDVGGKDMPVLVVWTKLLGGNFLFQKSILDGAAPATDVLAVNTSEDAKATVTSNPEAIAIGPVALIDNTLKTPETPEVARPITLITKGKPTPKIQKLIDFVKGEGQKYVKQ